MPLLNPYFLASRRTWSPRLWLAALSLVCGACFPILARAQSCPLSPRPIFAGHTLPLDSDPSPSQMTLVRAFPNLSFDTPVGFEMPPDDSDRIFIVEQGGRIYVFENREDVGSATLFLDIRSLVVSGGEQGLLGLAFDPDFVNNRRFYVNYTSTSSGCSSPGNAGCTKIVRYQASANDPDQADPSTRSEVLEVPQPYSNHNGGALEFGPDGMLYVAMGDGGSGGDPHEHAQNLSTRHGAILRLDVRDSAPSLAPADNPFVNTPGADPLIYHYGVRNPWRISFDRVTGDLLIADVGQSEREEVSRIEAGTSPGVNLGWDLCEGTLDYERFSQCSDIVSMPPVIEYDHDTSSGGNVIIGGHVYRGDQFPELYGAYLYSDAATSNIWAWDGQDPVDPWNPGNPGVLIGNPPISVASWGEDREGETYAVSNGSGQVFRLARNGSGTGDTGFPSSLSETGFFTDVASLTPAEGMIEYEVTAPLWSDGAHKRRWVTLPGTRRIGFDAQGAWQFPVGTAFVKHFELEKPGGGTRRVETRVFLRQTERWVGVTYRWNAQETEAFLLPSGLEEEIDLGGSATQPWRYPSSGECLSCHNASAGRVLSLRTRQLSGRFEYPATSGFPGGEVVQLEAWNCAGLFDFDIRDVARYAMASRLDDVSETRLHRMRSYAATNCALCHSPAGPAPGELDLRFGTAVGDWNVIDVPVSEGDLGIADLRRITTGDKARSSAWVRQHSQDSGVRMARGTLVPHTEAVTLFGDWIEQDMGFIDSDADGVRDALDGCPSVPDPGQSDRDQDGVGDACDPDDLPDLKLSDLAISTQSAWPGAVMTLSAAVENLGRTPAGEVPVTFYLSRDASFDPAHDASAGHCWLEALGSEATQWCQTASARVPLDALEDEPDPAEFHVVACANAGGVSPDVDPSADCVVSAERVTVPEPGLDATLVAGLAGLVALASGRARVRRRLRYDQPS